MPIFNNINGEYRKVSKPYCNVNGVQHQVKKAFCNVNGVWREAYTGEIKWTFSIKRGGIHIYKNGNSSEYTSYIGVDGKSSGNDACCDVTYNFTEPLILPAGSTFQVNFRVISGSDKGRGEGLLYFNGKESSRWSTGHQNDCCKDKTYSFSSNEKITSIKIRSYAEAKRKDYTATYIAVTVNQLNGLSFLLNNSGTSDQ